MSGNDNLREFFEGYAGWQEANISGFVTDEIGDNEKIDSQLQDGASFRHRKIV